MLEIPPHLPQTNTTLRDKLAVQISFLTEIQMSFNAATWTPNIANPDSALANHPCGRRAEGCHCWQPQHRAAKMLSSPFPSPAAQTAQLPSWGSPQAPAHTSCPGSARLLQARSWVHGGASSPWHWRPVLSLSHLPRPPRPHVNCCLPKLCAFPFGLSFSLCSLPN